MGLQGHCKGLFIVNQKNLAILLISHSIKKIQIQPIQCDKI